MEILSVYIPNEYVRAVVLILTFYVLGRIAHFLFKKYLQTFIKRVAHVDDDGWLRATASPLHMLIVLAGFFLAAKSLSILNPYIYWVNGIFFSLTSLLVSLCLVKLVTFFISRWFIIKRHYRRTPEVINKIVAVCFFAITIMIILAYFRIEITPLVATLGIGGIAIGLALQDTLSNFFAGLHIISDKPVDVGDFVELDNGDLVGEVEDIGWRSTHIRTLRNTVIIVPNSRLAGSVIVNNSLPRNEMSILVELGIAYGSNLEQVEKIALEVAKQIQKTTPGAVDDFEPLFRFRSFGESNINFGVFLRVKKYPDKFVVTHLFMKNLKKRFDQEGIEISWPVRKLYFANKPSSSKELSSKKTAVKKETKKSVKKIAKKKAVKKNSSKKTKRVKKKKK